MGLSSQILWYYEVIIIQTMVQEFIRSIEPTNKILYMQERKNFKTKEEGKIGYLENKTKLDPHFMNPIY